MAAGSRWLLDDAVPGSKSTPASAAAGCLVAAVCVGLWRWFAQKTKQKAAAWSVERRSRSWHLVVAVAVLLSAPALGTWIAGRHLSGSTVSLCLALTPTFTAIAVSAGAEQGDLPRLLWPGLAGLAGLLLLLPQPDVESWRPDLAYLAVPLMVTLGAVIVHSFCMGSESEPETSQTASALPFATVEDHVVAQPERGLLQTCGLMISLCLGLVLAAASFLTVQWATMSGMGLGGFPAIAVALDGLTVGLTILALLRLGAMRWSAQFLLVPLTTILEGIVVLRPALTVRSWAGLALLLLGGGLVLARSPESSRESYVPMQ